MLPDGRRSTFIDPKREALYNFYKPVFGKHMRTGIGLWPKGPDYKRMLLSYDQASIDKFYESEVLDRQAQGHKDASTL